MDEDFYKTGSAPSNLYDQYADNLAARVWNLVIGDKQKRLDVYRDLVVNLFREKGVKSVLDVATGTGIDSIMLVEAGFKVTSVDFSNNMLKICHEERWQRRKDPKFEDWALKQGNWVTLTDDLGKPAKGEGFDAIICLGNSFAHLPAPNGDRSKQQAGIQNFYNLLKPGGHLLIDHRNYERTLFGMKGKIARHNYLFDSKYMSKMRTSVLWVDNKPEWLMMDYFLDISELTADQAPLDATYTKEDHAAKGSNYHFRMSLYPHMVEEFSDLLKGVFGSGAEYLRLGDFKSLPQEEAPVFYQHLIRKAL